MYRKWSYITEMRNKKILNNSITLIEYSIVNIIYLIETLISDYYLIYTLNIYHFFIYFTYNM